MHKWACAPRGSAFLWAREELQSRLEPPVLSHGHGGGFASSFIWSGAGDYSAPLAAAAVIQRWWGGDNLAASVAYQRGLLTEATALLSDAWGTATLVETKNGYNMALVRLPKLCALRVRSAAGASGASPAGDASPTGVVAASPSALTGKEVQDALHFGHRVECPVKTVGGELHVRISAAAYNERADYEALARAVESMRVSSS